MKRSYYISVVGLLLSLMAACRGFGQNPSSTSLSQVEKQTKNRVAYAAVRDGKADIYVLDLDTRKETKITKGLDLVQDQFDWSPDGTRIVVTIGDQYEESELVVIDVDSGQITQLTDNRTMDESPAWSPNGKLIAFQSGLNTRYGSKLWYIDPEGLDRQPLSKGYNDLEGYHFTSPVWSPDSKSIAATIRIEQNTIKIYVFDFLSGEVIRIIGFDGLSFAMPAWSPDGQLLAYTHDRHGSSDIYVQPWSSKSESEMVQITNMPGDEGWIEWSTDGKSILFTNAKQDEITYTYGPANVFVVDVESLKIQQLTDEASNWTPSWAPDGAKIVFGTSRGKSEFVAVMNKDGSDQAILKETESEVIWAPKWAPGVAP